MSDQEIMVSLRKLGLRENYPNRDTGVLVPISLKPHQMAGVRFGLSRKSVPLHDDGDAIGCMFAFDVGLGKTLVALALLLVFKYVEPGPCIVVCPGTIKQQWANETYQFFGSAFDIIMAEDYGHWFRSAYLERPVFTREVFSRHSRASSFFVRPGVRENGKHAEEM